MTFQRKLLLGFSLMAVPALLIAAEAIRTNGLERKALNALGDNMARNRSYGELEAAMSDQAEVVWRYLTGMDSTGKREFALNDSVIDYWHARWSAGLPEDERGLADTVHLIRVQIGAIAQRVFAEYDAGHHLAAYQMAQRDLRDVVMPALSDINREVYRRTRESSVRGAYAQLANIIGSERWALLGILILSLGTGLVASWLIAGSLSRPIRELSQAMAVVGTGDLEHPISVTSNDEIGQLATAFSSMTSTLRQTQARLVQSERLASIGEMSAAVAHGLRNPLASLRAAAQLGSRHAEGASREHFDVIIEEVDRLDRRVSHLLSFSRPAPFHPSQESVATLIDDLRPTFAELLKEHRVILEVDAPSSLRPVRVDPMQLEQALLEIISNSLDAMPNGGRLSIGAKTANQGVEIEITDTGGGIPANIIESVCEPFFTTRHEGTGLGLAIAKRYVEQNGGRLAIVSEHGGTTVRVWLP
ncbi:MAG TPA: ATP-binding protein [Gemmatimonadaceae bacterium]|nr:ATP-binding protein [Gemmatimonadaceae bacterium]